MLIAACHVLHRLSTPRHPSEALMRLIVLSKTHAWGRLRGSQVTQLPPRPHMRFGFTLPDYDVFSGSALSNSLVKILADLRSRADPSFHDVKPARPLGLAGIRLLSSIASWWSQTGSNRRPHACKARALPTELWPQGYSPLWGFDPRLGARRW